MGRSRRDGVRQGERQELEKEQRRVGQMIYSGVVPLLDHKLKGTRQRLGREMSGLRKKGLDKAWGPILPSGRGFRS